MIDRLDFVCLMAYHPSWVIQCQIHPSRRTVVLLFKDKGVHAFPKSVCPKANVNIAGKVRTRALQFRRLVF